MTTEPAPIEREPRRVRPPYDTPDDSFDHLRATSTQDWRTALRLDRLIALREPLDGLDVTDYEHQLLEWLTGLDTATVAVVAGLLHRARAAAPMGHKPAAES